VVPFGENGWLAQFGEAGDDVALALHIHAVAATLRAGGAASEVVAGVDSIALRFDPRSTDGERVRASLDEALAGTPFGGVPPPARTIEIPIAYGGDFGPDLDDLCALSGLRPEALIEVHASVVYRVLMIGFAPGFAYLGPLDPRLRAPRLETPRARVAAGSVGVAGDRTGIYSLASPGGWRVIGRTSARLFDSGSAAPFRLVPGDAVRFTPERTP
jgi:KipI family sensor histidine kinase inhibitor